MLTDPLTPRSGLARFFRIVSPLVAVILAGAALTVASSASAQNLVTNGTFAITGTYNGTATSFWFGGYSYWGGSESLSSWTFVPAGSGNIGAGFDFVNGATAACYGGSSTCTSGNNSIETILPQAVTAPVGGNFIAVDANWSGNTQSSGVTQSVSGLTTGASYTLAFSFALTKWNGDSSASDSAAITAQLGSASQTTNALTITSPTSFSGWVTETFTFVATSATETLALLASGGSGQPPLALIANVSLTKSPEPMSIAILATGILGLAIASRKRRAPTYLA